MVLEEGPLFVLIGWTSFTQLIIYLHGVSSNILTNFSNSAKLVENLMCFLYTLTLFLVVFNFIGLSHQDESDIIDGIYYRGEWKLQKGSVLSFEEQPGEGYIEMVLENSTLIYYSPNMTKPFTFVVGFLGIRMGMFAGTEQELLYLYGVLSPSGKYLYSYIFDSTVHKNRITQGNPVKDTDCVYPYLEPNPDDPFVTPKFSPRGTENEDAFEAYWKLYPDFFKLLEEEGFDFEALSPGEKKYVYKTVLEITAGDEVDVEIQEEFDELRRISVIYQLKGKMLGISKDAKHSEIDLFFETKLPQERYREILHYVILMTFMVGMGLVSLMYQVECSSTPSLAARVSYHGIGLLVLIDGYYFLFHLVACLSKWKGCFFMMSIVSFLHVVSFFGFEMKFFLFIWKATNGVGGGRTWRQVRRGMSSIYGRYYIIFFIGLFLLIRYPQSMKFFSFPLFSIWIPQIIHNVYYDIKKSVNISFILGQSVSKLSVICYFYLYPNNFLMVEQDVLYVILILTYVLLIQCGLLITQRVIGGRFYFFKVCMGQKRYNYKKPIPDDLLESGECQCSICLDIVEKDAGDHMLTPCNHVFHENCLRRWSEEKLECPICRQALPFLHEID